MLRRQLEKRARSSATSTTPAPSWSSSCCKRGRAGDVEPLPHDPAGYFDLSTDLATDVRKEMVNASRRSASWSRPATTRSPSASTRSTSSTPTRSRTADNAVTFKTTLKAIAQQHGLYATFMPKPFFGINGSGMHTHQSLWDAEDGKNAFYDADDEYGLSTSRAASSPACSTHARGMIAILAPLVNCYKRLVPGYEAPVYISWARINRSALIRIPQISTGQLDSHAHRAALPRPVLQPVPGLRRHARGRAWTASSAS